MKRAIAKTLATLADGDAGWVNRRDAAVELGSGAVEAVRGLQAYQDEPDQDVRLGIKLALAEVGRAVKGVDTDVAGGGSASLEKLVQALEKKGSRDVSGSGTGFEIRVTTKDGRGQTVYVDATESNTKRKIIRVSTRCAKANEKSHAWALTNNAYMSHCSLAIETVDGDPWFVLVNNLLEESVSFEELKLTVKEVAFYGDWVEEKLSGKDEH